jgi:hypothetical protein
MWVFLLHDLILVIILSFLQQEKIKSGKKVKKSENITLR